MKRHTINLLSLLLVLIIRLSKTEVPQLHPRGGQCSVSERITPNSTYQANILSVLSNLDVLSSGTKFASFSAGVGSDRVNGLFFCRPDLPIETCHACFRTIATLFVSSCNLKNKEAIGWYDECMLRYSNRTIIGTEETMPNTSGTSSLNVSDPVKFHNLLNKTMEGLIAKASKRKSHFALASLDFTTFEGLFAMALCMPDISGTECEHCLRAAIDEIPKCCRGSALWTLVYLPSCQVRYDTAPFVVVSPPSSLGPASAPAPSK